IAGVGLRAKEAAMGSTSDNFFASTDADSAHNKIAFQTWPGSLDAGSDLIYKFGAVGYGWAGGVVGCAGTNMTRLLGSYSSFAGVHGTARDFTGVAGTSINHVGVYGQVEDNVPIPDGFHAGVLGASSSQSGVIGFSQYNVGAEGVSKNGLGVLGVSSTFTGVLGESDTGTGVLGIAGTIGPPAGMGLGYNAGVFGTALLHPGVIGTSRAPIGGDGFSI